MANDKNAEHWRKLCEQAVVEQDSRKLIELIVEINLLLSKKQQQPQQHQPETSAPETNRKKAA